MGNFIKIYSLMYYFNLLHFIALTEPAEKRAWGGGLLPNLAFLVYQEITKRRQFLPIEADDIWIA